MTKQEKFLEDKIKEIARAKIIFDIGAGMYKFQGLEKYKECFRGSEYKTIDIREEFHPDIVADAHDLPLPDNSADAVICKSVLQFTRNPFKVSDEVLRVLKPQGKCLLYLPFIYPYHGDGEEVRDCWRFSVDGINELLRKFSKVEICPVKGQFETAANTLPFQKGLTRKIIIFAARFFDFLTARRQSGRQAAGYLVYIEK